MFLVERSLDGVEFAVVVERFHGHDFGAVDLDGVEQTGFRQVAVVGDRTRPTDAVFTADADAAQPGLLAQEIRELQARFHLGGDPFAVDRQLDPAGGPVHRLVRGIVPHKLSVV